jgi:KUP system potassium uptake protein
LRPHERRQVMSARTASTRSPAQTALVVGALGVVFGDIGTSPIYTVQTIFNPDDPHPVTATTQSVYGLISLIVWSVTIIVTLKYVLLVMRADNDGEGGILALITLIRRRRVLGGRRTKLVLAALGVFGASLFFGDSMITPAISVLSAIEGLKVAAPSLAQLVVPITAAIIVVLFLVQRIGTGAVGRLFGPVMAVLASMPPRSPTRQRRSGRPCGRPDARDADITCVFSWTSSRATRALLQIRVA